MVQHDAEVLPRWPLLCATCLLLACSGARTGTRGAVPERSVEAASDSDGEASAAPEPWRWAGVEYVGPDSLPKATVLQALGVELGAPIPDDAVLELVDRCRAMVAAGTAPAADCTVLRFGDRRAFALVSVPDGTAVPDRAAPSGPSAYPDPRLVELLVARIAAGQRLFEAGDVAAQAESWEPGYLTWADPGMAAMAEELHALAVPHRQALVTLVLDAAEWEVRAKAATLLNWVGAPEQVAPAVAPALSDPDLIVRNNVSRYLLHVVDRVEDPDARRTLAEALAVQLQRPDMADRNKALFGLSGLAASDSDPTWMRPLVAERARRIAQTSILPNVSGVAATLLFDLGLAPPRPPADAVASSPTYDPTLLTAVQAYADAFNAHDVPAMRALVSDDVRVYYGDARGELALGTEGAEALASELTAYFAQLPTVRSEVLDPVARAPFVWYRERVSWADGSKSQASDAVYEFRQGRVVRALYLPAE